MSVLFLESKFNPEQRAAIISDQGHMLIHAAAGTGKTTTLAARILYLQSQFRILGANILALSYSRTAKQRLIEKMQQISSEWNFGSPIPVLTFHGLAWKILSLAIGYNDTWLRAGFAIHDTLPLLQRLFAESEVLHKHLHQADIEHYASVLNDLRQGGEGYDPFLSPQSPMLNEISEMDTQTEYGWVRLNTQSVIHIWKSYQNAMKRWNTVDYAEMVTEAIKVLQNPTSSTYKRVREGLKYILVDEYQDTSRAQEELLFLLAGNDIPLNVVGDQDQTIHTFSGSCISNIRKFPERVAGSTGRKPLPTVFLSENYRSAKNIISLANRIRKDNSAALKPSAQASSLGNEAVRVIKAGTLDIAADFVSNEVRRLIMDGVPGNEIAILVRKDSDHSPQGRSVSEKLAELGLKAQQQLDATRRYSVLQFLYELCQEDTYYGYLIKDLQEVVSTGAYPVPNSMNLKDIINELKDLASFGAEYAYDVLELIYEEIMTNDTMVHADGIQIRTIHSAKGEEFRVVFLMYLADRAFPHGAHPDLAEERRLLYVGITRAKERLYVIGKPSSHSTDFFEECKGPGAIFVDLEELGKREAAEGSEPLKADWVDSVRRAKREQLKESKKVDCRHHKGWTYGP